MDGDKRVIAVFEQGAPRILLDASDPVDQRPPHYYEDADGCADRDNDADGIQDSEDDCPSEPGVATSVAGGHGCPSPDTDGDTFDDPNDRCPNEPEDFDTVADDDGCPEEEEKGTALFSTEKAGSRHVVVWTEQPRFAEGDDEVELDPSSKPSLRAVAQHLNAHPTAVAWVGVQPASESAADHEWAVRASFAVVHVLRQLTYRDTAAELVAWPAIPEAAQMQQRIGVVLVDAATDDPLTAADPP